MGAAKWIAGFLGWAAFGPLGALVGYFLGKVVDEYIDQSRQLPPGDDTSYTRQSQTGRQTNTGRSRGGYTAQEQRNSFFVSLLVLSSAVIRADGKTLQSELDCVREFFRRNFGDQAASEAMRVLQQLGTQEINVYQVGGQIQANMNYSQRLQLLHFLVQIAVADGDFAKKEKDVLEVIGSVIGLTDTDVASVIAMFYKERGDESAYTILEISPSATDDEVRAAYRRMAMKYHPDRVSTLGEDVQKAAAQKFQQVHDAYETIKRQRGMN
jgi:DnaJ like chaperone protein